MRYGNLNNRGQAHQDMKYQLAVGAWAAVNSFRPLIFPSSKFILLIHDLDKLSGTYLEYRMHFPLSFLVLLLTSILHFSISVSLVNPICLLVTSPLVLRTAGTYRQPMVHTSMLRQYHLLPTLLIRHVLLAILLCQRASAPIPVYFTAQYPKFSARAVKKPLYLKNLPLSALPRQILSRLASMAALT